MSPFNFLLFEPALARERKIICAFSTSVLLNVYLLASGQPKSEPFGRGLQQASDPAHSWHTSALQDCASVSCPAFFRPEPQIMTGHSVYRPFLADTRFRRRPPHDMQELTNMLYGTDARLGEPYHGYDNPFGRSVDMRYPWTQVNERILDQAFELLGGRIRFVIEVGSFVGKSSVLIAEWLRKLGTQTSRRAEARRQHEERPVPLLCIDTWTGDLGMTLGHIFKDKLAKRNGMPTLYHTWLMNVIAANHTERILPLVAPSLLAARVLDYTRLAADIIYLDSAHEQQETFLELVAFWPAVRPGGLLIGDDFNWKAVSHDLQLFARTYNVTVESFNGCHQQLRDTPLDQSVKVTCVWYLRKPSTADGDAREWRRPARPRLTRFRTQVR